MGPDRWVEFGHMEAWRRVPGGGNNLFNKYLLRTYSEPGPASGTHRWPWPLRRSWTGGPGAQLPVVTRMRGNQGEVGA